MHETEQLYRASAPKIYDVPLTAVLELIDVSCDFNTHGEVVKAFAVTDLCWAVLEGIKDGVHGAITDIAHHPLQAVACVMAGEYVLAYQLIKVAYNVAGLGALSLINPAEGSRKWNEYIEPIDQCIKAIQNKEISLRDGVKGVTQLVVGYVTQRKLLGSLSKLYSGTKTAVLAYAKKYPNATPQQYMTTPEGMVFKAIGDAHKDHAKTCFFQTNDSKLPNGIQWTNHGYKHAPPKNISWKEIVKFSKHSRAYYKPGMNIKKLELHAWEYGQKTTNGKNWKVFKFNEIIGAHSGNETSYVRVECSANTIHGHPISEYEYLGYLK